MYIVFRIAAMASTQSYPALAMLPNPKVNEEQISQLHPESHTTLYRYKFIFLFALLSLYISGKNN